MDYTPELLAALQTLNKAAYAALRASNDTTANPQVDRLTLRAIVSATDYLVDGNGRPCRSEEPESAPCLTTA